MSGLEGGLVIWGQLDNKIACFVLELCHDRLQNERNLVLYLHGRLWAPLQVTFRNVVSTGCQGGVWGGGYVGALGHCGRKE